jgi:hypothetical protein
MIIGSISIVDIAKVAAISQQNLTIHPVTIAQTFLTEMSAAELKNWCSKSSGTWLGKSCEWQDMLEEERELNLDGQCRDRGGIWQTLYEEIVVPNCQGDVCTLEIDADNIEYVETGIGCVWENSNTDG